MKTIYALFQHHPKNRLAPWCGEDGPLLGARRSPHSLIKYLKRRRNNFVTDKHNRHRLAPTQWTISARRAHYLPKGGILKKYTMPLILTYRRIVMRYQYIKTSVMLKNNIISVSIRFAFVTSIRQMIALCYV